MEELEDNELEGPQYDELILDENAHKIVGKLTKSQGGSTSEVEIDEGTFWVVKGLGQLNDKIPDTILAESLKDTIIISKTHLIEFLKSKK